MYNRGSKRSAKRTTTAKRKYRQQVIESLECRQLLTTLYGGGAGRAAHYYYGYPSSAIAEITIFGNVTAEFIFADPTGAVVNRPVTFNGPNGANDGTGGFVGGAETDLFAVYVSKSDINSYISIEQVDTTTLAETPFGSATSITINPANPKSSTLTASSGSGGLRLGALTGGTTGAPIIKTDINGAAIGVRPAGLDDLPEDPGNDLSAGLRVANGQDLGKFLFDGEVFGKVHVDGSMNLFYAGWLLTGDARGAEEGVGTSGLPLSKEDPVFPSDAALGETFEHVVPRQNFFVGGDLQNLVSDGAIGWDATFGDADPNLAPFYLSGVDIYVRGRIGQIHGNKGNTATVTALNLDPAAAGFKRPVVYQEELEGWEHLPGSGFVGDFFSNGGFPNSSSFTFSGGVLRGPQTGRDNVPFENDTFDSAQLLGTFDSRNGNDIIDLLGGLIPNGAADSDPVDYFGVALMAGQTVRVQVRSLGQNAYVGVFDPDGRLIASDYNNLSTPVSGSGGTSAYTYQLPFQFTADRPGIYRIAVGERGDADFTGSPNFLSPEEYELTLTNTGVMAIGGVSVSDQFTSAVLTPAGVTRMLDITRGTHQIEADNGDLGALYVSGEYNVTIGRLFTPTVAAPPGFINSTVVFGSLYVPAGNLRTLDVGILGVGTPNSQTVGAGIDLNVPNGSVGLVQTRDPGGIMELNPSLQTNFDSSFFGGSSGSSSAGFKHTATPTGPTTPVPFTPDQLSIGRNYQVINSASRFTGGVFAKGGMGILRADAISGANQTYIYLDTDNAGFDGKSDLIDVATSIDGPALQHGPGGNFRYFRVGGAINVDSQFGVSNFGYVVHDYGQSAFFTDDSGSSIYVTPVGPRIANPAFNPLDPTAGPQFFLPQLSTMAYPVRSGGEIVMDVQSTGSVNVYTQSGSGGGTAEISRIEVHGDGLAPTRTTRFTRNGFQTTLTEPFTSQVLNNELAVNITGSAITDVAYIVGLTPEPNNNFFTNTAATTGQAPPLRSIVSTFSNLTSVTNNTGGEILSVNAATLGNLRSTGPVGVQRTMSVPGNALNFIAPITVGTAYAGRSATDATGDAPVNPTGTAVGSTYPFNGQTFGIAIGGDIVSIVSNRGLGNIISTGLIGSVVANADGKNVAGEVEGVNAPIVALGATTTTIPGSTGISNGSILAVNIGEGMGSAGSGDFARTGIFAGNAIGSIIGNKADIRGTIVFGQTLGGVTLNGGGSLIDANILNVTDANWALTRESGGVGAVLFLTNGGAARNIGGITINGNGGIIGTLIATANIGSISVPNGFGIISSEILTGFTTNALNSVTAGGYGIRDTIINTGNTLGVVNVTGNGKNLSTNKVSASVRQSEFVFADPSLLFGFDPFSGRALTAINDIHAALGTSQASPVVPGVTDTGVIENTHIETQRGLGRIVAQTIRGDDGSNGRPLTLIHAGNSIDSIQTRGLINGLEVTTGRLGRFLPGSNVGRLFMNLAGPLDNLTIHGSLNKGSVINVTGRDGRIGTVNIRRNLNGTIHATQSIGTVIIGRNLNGSLQIDARNRGGMALNLLKVGGTIANGALQVGSTGRLANVGDIIVGKGLGGTSADSLFITGHLNRLEVGKSINATVKVRHGIGTLVARRIDGPVTVGGDLNNLDVRKAGLHGKLNVHGRLVDASIHGGVTANIRGNNGIGNLAIGGDVAPGVTILSNFASIGTLRVSGDLDGSVEAAGQIGQITTGGNLGDGTTPLKISASRLGLLDVGGSIRNAATVDIRGPIDTLIVGKDIEEGAIIQATAVNHNKIKGNVFGTLSIG